ncbi:Alpha/beta hydrolase family-domain-containing protein [Peziza echinospora]|nr:Alpha/beta hydrolase family-domain-containing protein [Peziza echinospora]
MSTPPSSRTWAINTHTISAAHPRQNLRSVRTPQSRLKLVLNQYIPISNQAPSPGDVTIILAHANGFHKELYEPLFDDLLAQAKSSGFGIKAIWAPDAAHQGASGVLNENELGDDPCWFNYSRDIEHMINTFPTLITHPIIGMGHSMGGQAIFECALRNPTLFIAIVGLDPVIQAEASASSVRFIPNVTTMTVRRRDIWPSKEDAVKFFKSRPFYRSWDERVFDLHMKHGLRPAPTRVHPTAPPGSYTLATTKHQEAMTFLLITKTPTGTLLHRPEPAYTFSRLQELTIPILWVFGETSDISTPESIEQKMEKTRHAEMVVLKNGGHLLPLQMPGATAESVAPFIARHVRRWEKEVERDIEERGPVGCVMPEEFVKTVAKL